jgi:hypothetical protein
VSLTAFGNYDVLILPKDLVSCQIICVVSSCCPTWYGTDLTRMQKKITIETKADKTESMCCRRASSSNVTRRRLLWELCVEKCYGHHRLNKHIQHSAKLPVSKRPGLVPNYLCGEFVLSHMVWYMSFLFRCS